MVSSEDPLLGIGFHIESEKGARSLGSPDSCQIPERMIEDNQGLSVADCDWCAAEDAC
jgi:hypothetical protein